VTFSSYIEITYFVAKQTLYRIWPRWKRHKKERKCKMQWDDAISVNVCGRREEKCDEIERI